MQHRKTPEITYPEQKTQAIESLFSCPVDKEAALHRVAMTTIQCRLLGVFLLRQELGSSTEQHVKYNLQIISIMKTLQTETCKLPDEFRIYRRVVGSG